MTLRDRITVLTAAAVATGVALVAAIVFVAEYGESMDEVDALLREKAAKVSGNAVELVSADVEEWDLGHARVVRADGTSSPRGMAGLDAAVEPWPEKSQPGSRTGSPPTSRSATRPIGSSPSRSATERRCRWPNHSARRAASCSTWRASSAWRRSAA